MSLDACFKTKCKNRGLHDPELGSGSAYFVNEVEYMAHLSTYKDDTEVRTQLISFLKWLIIFRQVSTCDSTHNAVVAALTRKSEGYIATGVGGVKCARHNFVLPNGMGDLQKGERCVAENWI